MEKYLILLLQIHRQILPVERNKNKKGLHSLSFVPQRKILPNNITGNLTKTIHAKRRALTKCLFFILCWIPRLFFFVKAKAGKFAAHYYLDRAEIKITGTYYLIT